MDDVVTAWFHCGARLTDEVTTAATTMTGPYGNGSKGHRALLFCILVCFSYVEVMVELDRKGIDLHSVLCPMCENACESIDHGIMLGSEVIKVTEHPDSDSGKREFKLLMNFSELTLVDFRIWQKKMHFLLFSMSVVYVLTTLMPEDGGDNPTVEKVRKRAKWDNDDYGTLEAKYMAEDASSKKFLVSCIIDQLPPSCKDFKHILKYLKEKLTLVKLGSHLRIEESLKE
ncbi:hypothetical protein Tco_1326841 [Tanacetum coccineum]